jgi:hypothetical protein
MSDTSDLIVMVPLFECGKFKVCSLEPSTTSSVSKDSPVVETKPKTPKRRFNVVSYRSANIPSGRRVSSV